MTITYLRWRDALSEEATDATGGVVACLAELQEVGFLLHETDEAVAIGMEMGGADLQPGRWRLHVPKANIIERRDVELDQLSKRRRKRNH